METALICGVSGQDGSYLAKLLIEKGYRVVGTSRDAQVSAFGNLHRLGIFEQIEPISMAPTDFRSALQTLAKIKPDEVYNLTGQSSVGLSFEQPVETMDSINIGTLNLLEAIRFLQLDTRLYNASSSECFGDTGSAEATEETSFRPRSPYAVAKAAAHWTVINYREAYGIFAANGILFNHDSPLRAERFVTKKIVAAACRIKLGHQQKLQLGNLNIQRDWGWAPDYVDAMWRILQHSKPEDFIVGTGTSYRLEQFVEAAFGELGLRWQDHVELNNTLYRPTDILHSRANPTKASERIGWRATVKMPEVVQRMVAAELHISSSCQM